MTTSTGIGLAGAGLLMLASGCTTSNGTIAVTDRMFTAPISVPAAEVADWRAASIQVTVPLELDVSADPSAQFPRERIVWWGEPGNPEDRREQVDRLLTNAISLGAAGLKGDRPVTIAATVNLFHAVTPHARNNRYFAWHDVTFDIAVFDARTGAPLTLVSRLNADLEALRGAEALEAEAAGATQEVRITRRVAEVVAAWLASSGAEIAPAAAVANAA